MGHWSKVSWTTARQIIELMGEDAVDAADARMLAEPPEAYFRKLVADGKLSEAVKFVGLALPRYEGIVWAVQSLLSQDAMPRTSPLVTTALRWIDDPDDGLRRNVYALASKERKLTPARLIGEAIFFSGGTISEPDLPPVLPAPEMSGHMVGYAVIVAGHQSDKAVDLYRTALAAGEKFAEQGHAG